MRLLALFVVILVAYLQDVLSEELRVEPLLNNEDEPRNYALLVTGGIRSKYFWHYAIEAGVLGAYDVLLRNKIPAENIIMMSYNDAPYDQGNPCKGKVFNSPEWRNVYDEATVDYKDTSVTPENVLNVLKGDAAAVFGGNGKVVESTSKDRIFVFLSGEGSGGPPGMTFQNHTMLWADDFVDTLRWMHKNKKYAEMAVYLDTDYGSCFLERIPNDINVYSISDTSMSFPPHGSLFCELWHCNGTMPCLTREFPFDWQEDVKNSDLSTKSFHEHIESMKNLTVDYERGMGEYGDLNIGRKPIGCFLADLGKTQKELKC